MRGVFLASTLALTAVAGSLSAVHAQDAAQAGVPGITVVGYGEASAPAETAEIQLLVGQANFGGPIVPQPGATPGAEERESLAPTVDALVAAGIPEADITVLVSPIINGYYGPGGPAIARVDFTITGPTLARIDELLDAATVGAAEERLTLGQIGVGYGIADCAPLERQAREAALEDAGARGTLQAELLGVEPGEVVASRDVPVNPYAAAFGYYGATPSDAACSPPVPSPQSGVAVGYPAYDPTQEPVVQVYAQLEVTYEIGAGTDATPAA